jgi:hypothetical protein
MVQTKERKDQRLKKNEPLRQTAARRLNAPARGGETNQRRFRIALVGRRWAVIPKLEAPP